MPLTPRDRRLLVLVGVPLLVLILFVLIVKGCGDGADSAGNEQGKKDAKKQKPLPQLPGGGRRLFPDRRVVAYYGNPRDDELGALGIGSPDSAAKKLAKQVKAYERKSRPVLPAMELITTLATAAPGEDGKYSVREPTSMIDRYLAAARRAKAILILDIQPGRAEFGTEIERLKRYLEEPDVGLALDPEWHVAHSGGVPGKVIGTMDADAVNAAAAYLSEIVQRKKLPEKLLLVHRFTDDMILRDERLRQFKGVRTVINIDGFGYQSAKIGKYKTYAKRTPKIGNGFKLFYKEDKNLMSPKQVLRLRPPPDVVVYE